MSEFLRRSVQAEASRRQREMSADGGWHRSFCNGAAHRIHERCHQLRVEAERASIAAAAPASTGTALVLASVYASELSANEAFLKAAGIQLTQRRSSGNRSARSDAYASGRDFGENASLHRQVNASRIRGQLN